MIFNTTQGKVYISEKEYIDKTKGFNISNIDMKDNVQVACELIGVRTIHVTKNGQLMIGPYELHITS